MQLPAEWTWAIVVALVGVFGWLMPPPWKWFDGHRKQVEDLRGDHMLLVEKHNALERRQIEVSTRLGTELRALADAVRELRSTIKELTSRMDQRHGHR